MSEQNEQSNIVEFPELKFPPIEYGVTEAALATLTECYKDPDASTDEGYEHCKDGCRELTAVRTAIETRRKDLKAPALDWGRDVDKQAKDIVRRVKAIEAPVRAEKERIDEIKQTEALEAAEAEQKRIESIHERIGDIRDSVARVHAFGVPDVKQVKKEINGLDKLEIDDSFGEFADEANDAKIAALAKLREIYAAAIVRDEDARKRAEEKAALDKQREEQEATEKRQREAEETLENKAREAEQRKAAAEKAAQDKAERERAQKTEYEKKRIDKIKAAIKIIREKPAESEGLNSESLSIAIHALRRSSPDAEETLEPFFQEFLTEAQSAWERSIKTLEVMANNKREIEARDRRDEEARLPDKDKLIRWCAAIAAVTEPEVLNDKAQKILRRYGDDLRKLTERLRSDIGKL